MRFKLSEAANGETYFEIQTTDNHVVTVATSDTYPTPADALAAIEVIKSDARSATVVGGP
jgi:uncharacterized protein YegP (UPF0339 family)